LQFFYLVSLDVHLEATQIHTHTHKHYYKQWYVTLRYTSLNIYHPETQHLHTNIVDFCELHFISRTVPTTSLKEHCYENREFFYIWQSVVLSAW